MRKIFVILIFIASLLTLASCSGEPPHGAESQTQSSSSTPSVASQAAQSSSEILSSSNRLPSENDDAYYFQMDSDFNRIFDENPIDQAYKQESGGTTTVELALMEQQYYEYWKSEAEFSVNNLKKLLTKEDAEDFADQQHLWEKWVEESVGLVSGDILTSKYGVNMGTQRQYVFNQERIKRYRERDAQIKFLTYILEVCSDKPKPEGEWSWNQFSYSK